jgi:hypothetical protein
MYFLNSPSKFESICWWKKNTKELTKSSTVNIKSEIKRNYSPFKLKIIDKNTHACVFCPWFRFCTGCVLEPNNSNYLNFSNDYVIVKGAIFDFRGAILPVEFVVKNQGGMQYFESLDASSTNPTFTKVWGTIKNETIVTTKEEESAFGEPQVTTSTRNVREWIITGTSKPDAVYEIGDAEKGVTADEIKKAMADREIHLAEVKKNNEEYRASRNAGSASPSNAASAATINTGSFNF